jgi:hypothetical protein
MVRSRLCALEGSFLEPSPRRAPFNLLNYLNFNVRTKTTVVRLCRRKWDVRDGKRREMGLAAEARGSDKWPEMPTFCGVRTADQGRKRMSRLARLAEGEELWSNPLCAPGDRQMVADASSVR